MDFFLSLCLQSLEENVWPQDPETENGLITADKAGAISEVSDRKILFVTRTFEYGGAERHLLDLLSHLQQPGLGLSILCFGQDLYSERLDPKLHVAVTSVPRVPASLSEWISFFRQAKTDIVVFIYGWSWCFHWIAPIGAWLAGIPKRYAIQHLVPPSNRKITAPSHWLRKLLGHWNLKLSASLLSKTICVSNAVRNTLVHEFGFPKRRMKTIHNGVSLVEFSPSKDEEGCLRREFGIGADEFLLICAARLSKQKGIDILLRAMARIRGNGLSCKCIIVGDGPLRDELVALAQHLGLAGQVFFKGFSDDIRPYLRAGSAFILTSHYEGLPLTILEAAACGLPCIVTNVGGNAEAVIDQVSGLIVPAESVEAAADAIKFLATHPQEREQMSKMARARVQQEFDIEKCMSEIKLILLN